MKLKQCPKCKRFLPENFFNKKAKSKDGLQSYCRHCQRIYKREHTTVVQERLSELDKRFDLTVLPNGVKIYKHKEFKTP